MSDSRVFSLPIVIRFNVLDEESYAIQKMAYPSIYNLIVDPIEELPEAFCLDDTWVDAPLWQVIEDHQASIEKDSGTPKPW